jgi:hydrogenase maturation protein HypF
VHLIGIVSKKAEVRKIAFSGGVFQNAVLVDLCKIYLNKTNELYFHRYLSPNDENISFGQLVYYDKNMKSLNKVNAPEKEYMIQDSKFLTI